MKHTMRAACAAWVILCGLSVPFAAGAASDPGDRPVVSALEIVQSGTFAALPPEASPGGARYRMVRSGEMVEAAPGVAFGLAFAVKGEPAGQAVVVEARLLPPAVEEGTDGAPESGRRWFIPAVVGGTGQAVASFAYAWEAVPGSWRLTLAEGGRVLAEKIFSVGVGPAAASGTAPEAVSVFSVSPPSESGDPPAGVSSETIVGNAAEKPAESPEQRQPPAPSPSVPVVASLPSTPGAPVDPDAARIGQESAQGKTEKPAAKTPSASDKAPSAKAPKPAADSNPPTKAGPKPASKPDEVAGTGKGTTFLLQAGLFSVKDNAFSEAARYRTKGYPACVLEEGNGAKRRYRVIVGRFPDHERAVTARRAFLAREGGEVVIKELPAAEVSGRLFCR